MTSSYKIIIIGDSCVGKTSLMRRYVNNSFSERYKATIGVDFLSKTLKINNKIVELQIWDTAGSERFYSLSSTFYRGADGCIIVFDLTNMNSFIQLEGWIDEFLINCSPANPESYPFVILGNKIDLQNEIKVMSNSINRFCKNKNIKYFETSSKLDINVTDAFEYLINKILNTKYELEISYDLQSINIIKENDKIKLDGNKYTYCYCTV